MLIECKGSNKKWNMQILKGEKVRFYVNNGRQSRCPNSIKRNGRSERDNITGNRHRERRILSACNTKKEKPLKCGREGRKKNSEQMPGAVWKI